MESFNLTISFSNSGITEFLAFNFFIVSINEILFFSKSFKLSSYFDKLISNSIFVWFNSLILSDEFSITDF